MKNLILPTLAVAAVVISFLGVSAVSAQTTPLTETSMNRFGQNSEVVAEHRAEMKAHSEDVLNQAVEEGLMTEEQKQTMLAMREEFRATRGSSTPEDRQVAREAHRANMQSWQAANGIDLESVCDGDNEFKQSGFGRTAK